MSVIDQILVSEAKAQSTVEEAKLEAKSIVEQGVMIGHEKADLLYDKKLKELDEKKELQKELILKLKEDAKGDIDKKKDSLKADASLRLDEAANLIYRRLIS